MLSKAIAGAAALSACLLFTDVFAYNKFGEKSRRHLLKAEEEIAKRGNIESHAVAPDCRYYNSKTARE